MIATADHVLVEPGQIIFREGEDGSCAYIIEGGQVEITIERCGNRVVLARRGPGEVVGEMAIIDRKPRSATAIAVERCELLPITREQLTTRIEQADPILRMCLGMILERFRLTLRQVQAVEQAHASPADQAGPTPREAYGDHAMREFRLEQELRQALERGQLELHFQPIINLDDRMVAGMEALVRWRHPDRGLIAPGSFIPIAEASGLIVPLSRWVFGQACNALNRFWTAASSSGLAVRRPFMSINVSSRDFIEPDFIQQIDAHLEGSGADPTGIKLEITESVLMQQPDLAAAVLRDCKARGLAIAIDDFGIGYSSLSYLHTLPIDALKIDRSFVHAMHGHSTSRKIVGAIVGLAKSLDLPTVAEGVETASQANRLQDLGCTYGQGFLFAKPLPEDATLALLKGGPAELIPDLAAKVAG